MQPTIQQEKKFHRSLITQQLVQFLSSAPEGQLIIYEQLSEIACCDIQRAKRHFLETALEIVSKDYGIIFRCEHGRGIVRLSAAEISKYANQRHRSRLRQDTKRYQQKIDCVDSRVLTYPERQEYSLAITYLGIRNSLVSPKFDQVIRKELAQSPERQIDKAQLLEHIKYFG